MRKKTLIFLKTENIKNYETFLTLWTMDRTCYGLVDVCAKKKYPLRPIIREGR